MVAVKVMKLMMLIRIVLLTKLMLTVMAIRTDTVILQCVCVCVCEWH